jgi:methyl-accepting chemotaxis protein
MGIQDQTQGITTTAASMDALSKGIQGVARGAQDQGRAIHKAAEITTRISTAIQHVAGNAEAVTLEASKATQTAHTGTRMVEDTLQSMRLIKVKVDQSTKKVEEMGKRSTEIGIIVETIGDIASQTNLLALNAAIEAARAGEHGKGFAVVADEVRKLAERASSSTKAINQLVSNIHTTVNEAVQSMAEGSREVESGVQRANQSGLALKAIIEAIEAVSRQAQEAAQASKEMAVDSGEMVAAFDSVSEVVEDNNAVAAEMAASSNGISTAIENIASVSEENSAAVEQVSAAAEELTAQVENVAASAQAMAQLAQILETVVQEFKLE